MPGGEPVAEQRARNGDDKKQEAELLGRGRSAGGGSGSGSRGGAAAHARPAQGGRRRSAWLRAASAPRAPRPHLPTQPPSRGKESPRVCPGAQGSLPARAPLLQRAIPAKSNTCPLASTGQVTALWRAGDGRGGRHWDLGVQRVARWERPQLQNCRVLLAPRVTVAPGKAGSKCTLTLAGISPLLTAVGSLECIPPFLSPHSPPGLGPTNLHFIGRANRQQRADAGSKMTLERGPCRRTRVPA